MLPAVRSPARASFAAIHRSSVLETMSSHAWPVVCSLPSGKSACRPHSSLEGIKRDTRAGCFYFLSSTLCELLLIGSLNIARIHRHPQAVNTLGCRNVFILLPIPSRFTTHQCSRQVATAKLQRQTCQEYISIQPFVRLAARAARERLVVWCGLVLFSIKCVWWQRL